MRKKTVAKFELWKQEPEVVPLIFSRVANGESLKEICQSPEVKQPYTLVAKWIAETPALREQYDAALKIYADSIAMETVPLADGATPETVGVEKLRVETRFRLAGKLDRARFGEQVPASVSVNINLGDVAQEIVRLEERLGLRVQGEVQDAEVVG